MNPLLKLAEHGQSYWLDNLTRRSLQSGALARRVEHAGLRGVTSNPKTFHDSVAKSSDYDDEIEEAVSRGLDAEEIYEKLAVTDVQTACDVLTTIHDETEGLDGYVSLEVSPHLAHDTAASVAQARRFASRVGRMNLMVKIPGTRAGLVATEELLFDGINVNVTLLFSVERYEMFAAAYLRALERREREGRSLREIRSVASFFLSRIDVVVDELLAQRTRTTPPEGLGRRPRELAGKTAVANAKLAYQSFRAMVESERFAALARKGAEPQRLLWASTGTKNPKYRDVMYVEPLIGRQTVTTMPEETIRAFADHGVVEDTLERDVEQARELFADLKRLGIESDYVAERLENDGIQKFIEPYDALVQTLERRRHGLRARATAKPLRDAATALRRHVVRMTTEAGSGHPSSCLSCADLVAALFFHQMRWDPKNPTARNVDQFVLSKGHAAPILWAALSEASAITEDLLTLRKMTSSLEGHPTPRNPWVRVATGSLGQGLSVANGMALANRLDHVDARIYCLLGDGECSEGSVWEAAQFASLNRLSSVVAVVDVNGLGQSGLAPYQDDASVHAKRFEAFGWKTIVLDGHDMAQILESLHAAEEGGPTALVARTVKGKGVSLLEGQPGWHGKALDEKQMLQALDELGEGHAVAVASRRVSGPESSPEPTPGGRIEIAYEEDAKVATRTGFGKALAKLGDRLPELVVLDGDVKDSTRGQYFAEKHPARFVECYIAEQNMAGVALGLSVMGKLPVAATFAAFLTRAHDFIRMAAHSRPERLVFCGSHGGVSIGQDGPSQMGLEDLAMFRALLGSTVLHPSDAVSAERLTEEAMRTPGIVYLRTARPETPILYDNEDDFPVGGSKLLRSSDRDRATIVAAGITVHEALAAHDELARRDVRTRVLDAYSVKPLDEQAVRRAARETGSLIVVEDHAFEGGLGDAVSAAVGALAPVLRLAVRSGPRSASMRELLDAHGISRREIVDTVVSLTESDDLPSVLTSADRGAGLSPGRDE